MIYHATVFKPNGLFEISFDVEGPSDRPGLAEAVRRAIPVELHLGGTVVCVPNDDEQLPTLFTERALHPEHVCQQQLATLTKLHDEHAITTPNYMGWFESNCYLCGFYNKERGCTYGDEES